MRMFKSLLSCRPSPPTIPLHYPSSVPSILHSARQTIKASFSVADPQFTLTSAPSPVADGGVSYSPHGSKRGARQAQTASQISAPAASWLSSGPAVTGSHRQNKMHRAHTSPLPSKWKSALDSVRVESGHIEKECCSSRKKEILLHGRGHAVALGLER